MNKAKLIYGLLFLIACASLSACAPASHDSNNRAIDATEVTCDQLLKQMTLSGATDAEDFEYFYLWDDISTQYRVTEECRDYLRASLRDILLVSSHLK